MHSCPARYIYIYTAEATHNGLKPLLLYTYYMLENEIQLSQTIRKSEAQNDGVYN